MAKPPWVRIIFLLLVKEPYRATKIIKTSSNLTISSDADEKKIA